MAERIQLKEPGSELTLSVNRVAPEVIEKNEYYLFGNGSIELLVPQSSVKGQFERLGVSTVEQLIGKTVKFGRSVKMSRAGKPFWNLDLASGAETGSTPAAPASTGATGGSAPAPVGAEPATDEEVRAKKAKVCTAMKQANQYVIANIVPLYTEAKIGLTGDDCYKQVYTIFRTWDDAGLVQ